MVTTPEPEQIDLEAARKAAAMVHPYSHNSALILDGERDGTDIVQAALHGVRLGIEQGKRMAGGEPGSYPKSVWYTPEDNSSRLYIRDDIAQGWEEACKNLIAGSADDRDRSILLADLLKRAREYVTDALDAHEHSDGRDLLNEIDAALTAILPDLREQRNAEILPIRDLTIAEVIAEKSRIEALWDAFRSDDDFEGGGGSPGEWMYERMNEIDTALKPLREQHYAECTARIVGWLRKLDYPYAAASIERGDHITKEGE